MPELTEVELTRRKLTPLLIGRRITGFATAWPRGVKAPGIKHIANDIRGRCIRAVSRCGKVLFLELSGSPARLLALHLRMSGRLEVFPATVAARDSSNADNIVRSDTVITRTHITRAKLRTSEANSGHAFGADRLKFVRSDKFEAPGKPLSDRWVCHRFFLSGRPAGRDSSQASNSELRFIDPRKFGLIWYGHPKALARDSYLGALGEDAASVTRKEFLQIFRGRRGMVKAFLLDQRAVSGIGNIIADESLWRARIHPRRDVATLGRSDLLRLFAALRKTLSAMLSSGGTTLRDFRHPDGVPGRYQEQRVAYGRAGFPCLRCKTVLTRMTVCGRGTTVCRRCQKLSSTLTDDHDAVGGGAY